VDHIVNNIIRKKHGELFFTEFRPDDIDLPIILGLTLDLIKRTNSKNILHYGAMSDEIRRLRSWFYDSLGVEITLYDPYVDEDHSILDKYYDGVIILDILNKIPTHNIIPMLQPVFNCANRFILASFNTYASNQTYADGSPMAVNVKDLEWWHKMFTGLYEQIQCMQALHVTQVAKHNDIDYTIDRQRINFDKDMTQVHYIYGD
jgi:hypothetical protein